MSANSKHIAFGLDWDGTADRDPETFKLLIALLRHFGHKVYIVAMRYPSEFANVWEEMMPWVDGIVTTSRQAKDPACRDLGIFIDVWIDDNPRAVNESAKQIWGWASGEGHVIGASSPTHTPNELCSQRLIRASLAGAGVKMPHSKPVALVYPREQLESDFANLDWAIRNQDLVARAENESPQLFRAFLVSLAHSSGATVEQLGSETYLKILKEVVRPYLRMGDLESWLHDQRR